MLIFGSRALMLAAGHISPWRCGAPTGMLSPSISGKASLPLAFVPASGIARN